MVNDLDAGDESFRTELSSPRGKGLRPIPVSKMLDRAELTEREGASSDSGFLGALRR